MIALLTVIIFPIALMAGIATISWMFFGYHEKMMAALKARPMAITPKHDFIESYTPIRKMRTIAAPNMRMQYATLHANVA